MSFEPRVLSVPKGGTGATGFTNHGVVIGRGLSAISSTGAGTAGQVLTSNGSGADPSFETPSASGLADPGSNGVVVRTALNTTTSRVITGTTNQIVVTNGDGSSGNPTLSTPQDIATSSSPTFAGLSLSSPLTVGNGGSGATTHTAHGVLIGNGTSAVATTSAGTSGQVLTSNGASADPTFQAISAAPTGASYVTLGTDATLTSERVLTGTASQIIITDGGAGSTVTLSTPQNIATTSSPTFNALTLTNPLTIGNGGTGATTAQLARINLGDVGILSTTNNVDLTSAASTTLYTFSSFKGVVTKIILRLTSASAITVVGAVSFNISSGGDVVPNTTLTGLSDIKFVWEFNPTDLVRVADIGDAISVTVNTAYTATIAKASIEVIGYEY